MTHDPDRYRRTLAAFDSANADDPNQETWQGTAYPKELLYAQRMTACLDRFAPEASEALRLAARAQHIRRWTIPRDRYPMDRTGYKRWRTDLLHFHAETAGAIMAANGYGPDAIARVQALLRKRRLKRDADVQTLEDVVCLVFLTYYAEAFARVHSEEKMIGILRKTWAKMSEDGRRAALAHDLPAPVRALVERALATS